MPGGGLESNLFILTGAPGSGKTAILARLGNEFECVDEPAREVLAEQRATGGSGTWDQDASLFVHLLLQRSIQKYAMARSSRETVIFDRGIPDCIVYAVRAITDPTPSLEAADAYRELRDVYERSGYTLVEVPRDSIGGRATFVRMSIDRFGAIGTKGGA